MGKELVNLRDKVGWMEEEDRDPRNNKVTVVYTIDCTKGSRVWGVLKVWNKDVGRKQLGEIIPATHYGM